MLKTFYVEVQEIHRQVVEVQAIDADAARQAASMVVESGLMQDGTPLPEKTEYLRTVDNSEWNAWE